MTGDVLIIALSALAGLAILATAASHGWRGWLDLKAHELDRARGGGEPGSPVGMARIELSDLKERIRKLEAIAAGVDL